MEYENCYENWCRSPETSSFEVISCLIRGVLETS